MKTLKTIGALLICCSSFGQGKSSYNTYESDGDSTFWFKYQTTITRKLSLPLLDTTTRVEYFRIWTDKQAIDLWFDENENFAGTLTTWTDEYAPYNEEPTNRTFTKAKKLTLDTALLLGKLISSSGISYLPTGDSIKGWQNGYDGITYVVEHATKNNYSFKTYWTPKAQDSLQEAKLVQSFIDTALSLSNAQIVWKEFSKEIPFESYYNGGPGVTVRFLTKKERAKYKKERQRYRQQQLLKSKAAESQSN